MTDATYVALCAGGGLGCLGFREAGWHMLAAVEVEEHRRRLLSHRFPSAELLCDLRAVMPSHLPRARAWFATCPCTDYSHSGKRLGLGGVTGDLIMVMLDLYERSRLYGNFPEYVVLENVPGLLSSGADWEQVQARARAAGLFPVAADVLDARLFGVPQQRERLFAVWSSRPVRSPLPRLRTAPYRQRMRHELPHEALGRVLGPESVAPALKKADRAAAEDSLNRRQLARRIRAFCGVAPKPPCWDDRLVVYVDNGASSVGIGQSATLAKRSRYVLALDAEDRVRAVTPEGWEWLMGAPFGFTDDAGLTDRQRKEVCGDGICPPVARAVAAWLSELASR